jgi:hypothetical protein
MALRKWVVRSVVFALLTLMTAAGFAYHYWTNPVIVRQLVLARLHQHLPNADITLESAHLSLFGGIPFSDLRIMERGDPAHSEVLHVPSGVIYYDKENLRKSVVVISKLEFHRPILHIIRHRDGTWNLAGVLPRPDPSQPVPIIQFRNATVFFEDQQFPTGLVALEVRDVDLKIINDPLPILTFTGSGRSEMLGKVELGPSTLDRRTNALALALGLPDVPVDRTLLKRVSAYLPDAAVRVGDFSGRAAIDSRVSYQPRSPQTWTHKVHCQLHEGRLQRPDCPLPIEGLEAEAHFSDSLVVLDSLTARAGQARLALYGRILGYSDQADLEGNLRVEHLDITPALLAALPEKLRHLEADYQPRGLVSLGMDFRRQKNQWRQHCLIQAENLSMACSNFRYLLERISGTIEHELDAPAGKETQKLKLIGYTGSQPVHIEADIRGRSPSAMDLHIWGRDIPLDAKLQAALQKKFQSLVRDFDPHGLGDFDAYLSRAQGEEHLKRRFLIRFHDADMRFRPFPYPLENVTGFLDIEPEHWEFRDFHGSHKGADFYSHGASEGQGSNGFTVIITGKNVLLDPEIQAAMQQEGLKNAWVNLTPSGRMDFEARVVKPPNEDPPDIDVNVMALGCRFCPGFFRYTLDDVRGLIHYHRGQIELTRLTARHDFSRLKLESGKVYLKRTGGLAVNLFSISGDPLVPDEQFLSALPGPMRQACISLQLHDPMTLLVRLLSIDLPADPGSPPRVYWEGGIRLQGATLWAGVPLEGLSGQIWCRGEHWGHFGDLKGYIDLRDVNVFGQYFQDVQAPLAVSAAKPYQLEFPDIRARVFGGDIVGRTHVEFQHGLRYEVNLSGSDLKLEEFARVNNLGPKATMSGLATARLFLTGQGNDATSLEGGGSIDVPNGKIYNNLPLLLDLIKVLNLRAPDRTAFEEAHIRFDLHGERVQFNQLDLIGNAISLSGKGSMTIKGTDLNLDFYPLWGRIMQWSPPGLDRIPPLISQSLLKIKMRGSLAEHRTIREFVPPVVEPVKGLFKTAATSQGGGK